MTSTPNKIDIMVGQNIGEHRARREISEEVAATALGLSVETFRACEAGTERFCAVDVEKLCQLLGIEPSSIYRAVVRTVH